MFSPHVWQDIMPVLLVISPGMHGRHDACRGFDWKNPGSQSSHTLRLMLLLRNLPASHCEQLAPYVPAGHAMHDALPRSFSVLCPNAQSWHLWSIVVFENVFTSHGSHSARPTCDCAFPGTQGRQYGFPWAGW